MRFAGRLIAGIVFVLLVAVVVLAWYSERSLRGDLEQEVRIGLGREARLVRDALPRDSLAWQHAVTTLSKAAGHRVTLVERSGRVRADSDVPQEQLPLVENHGTRPEIVSAFATGEGWAQRQSATIGMNLMYLAVRGGPGVVRVAASLTQVDETVHQAQRSVTVAALLALFLGSILAVIAGRSIARPLTQITEAARMIATGGLPRFPRSEIPDVNALVSALRQMHEELALRFESIRRQEAESGALVDAMIEGVLAADAKGRIIRANPAARRLLGYADAQSIPDLQQLFRAKGAREAVDSAIEGTAVQAREVDLDGRIILLSARPLPTGGAVLVLHDLTPLRRLEAMRRDFVANASHELKTPLTAISGYTETLLTDRPDPETTQRFLETILNNARRMQHLVDDQLDLSRIESGGWQPTPRRVDLASAVGEAWSACSDRAQSRGVHFEAMIPEAAHELTVDADGLRQILVNLFDNSVRHTPNGGTITLSSELRDGGMLLSVRDTGTGIASEHLPRIFERFYRADAARSREEGGTGLGLAIVKHLVEAHGGMVWAKSALGQGTTIACWFPTQ